MTPLWAAQLRCVTCDQIVGRSGRDTIYKGLEARLKHSTCKLPLGWSFVKTVTDS